MPARKSRLTDREAKIFARMQSQLAQSREIRARARDDELGYAFNFGSLDMCVELIEADMQELATALGVSPIPASHTENDGEE